MTDHIKQKTDNDLFVRSLMDSIQQQETYERKQRKQEEKQSINSWRKENLRRAEKVKATARQIARRKQRAEACRGHIESDTTERLGKEIG